MVYLLGPDILSRAQYPLPPASCTGTELQWLTAAPLGGFRRFLELVFVPGAAASWERLVLAACSSCGVRSAGAAPKGVCAALPLLQPPFPCAPERDLLLQRSLAQRRAAFPAASLCVESSPEL